MRVRRVAWIVSAVAVVSGSLVLGTPAPAGADTTAIVVRDTAPVPEDPGSFADLNGTLFFAANEDLTSRELWKSDGTADGTQMVKDIHPTDSSFPHEIVAASGVVFFAATDGAHGLELWKSDGTASGTQMVKDIRPGSLSGDPYDLAMIDGALYFAATNGTNGYELWKSDGTADGTVMIKDINPSGDAWPYLPTAFGDGVVFGADSGGDNYELWQTDGTADGTTMIADINPGSGMSAPYPFIELNGTLFFGADNGATGREVFKSDGTATGTQLVKDVRPGAQGSLTNSSDHVFVPLADSVVFWADDGVNGEELWVTDGTTLGTQLIDINTGGSAEIRSLSRVGSVAMFRADDGVNGNELWKTNGTAAGTVMVKDINPGVSSGLVVVQDIADVSGTAFFTATDGVNGAEPWMSDGTAAGTVMIRDVNAGSGGSGPLEYLPVGTTVYFDAHVDNVGTRLWKTIPFVNAAAPAPPSLGQFTNDGTPLGLGRVTKNPVVLRGSLNDTDAGDTLRLEVEVKPLGAAFDGTGVVSSAGGASGTTASVTLNLPRGDYHWRARVVDRGGQASAWVSFGGNAETKADFKIRGKT